MKFLALEHVVPSDRVTNAQVLQWVREANADLGAHHVGAVCAEVASFWEMCGTRSRFIRGPNERSIELAVAASQAALASANVEPGDVDLLIYAGVARGWLEPATANAIQNELGLHNATNFDVMDACASWLRALEIANSLMRGGRYRTALIVNCECNWHEFADLRFSSLADLRSRIAGLTIGEAATATVLSADDGADDDMYFTFRNYSECYDLCMIPLANADQFTTSSAGRVANRFYSHSHELIAIATRRIVETYRSDECLNSGGHDIAFGHSASTRAGQFVAKLLGLPEDRYFDTHAEYGNTVSASVPLAMSLAIKDGRLTRGMNCLAVVGSAGISIGLARFIY